MAAPKLTPEQRQRARKAAAVVVPVEEGPYLEQRYRELEVDLSQARTDHSWQAVAALERQRNDAFGSLDAWRKAHKVERPTPEELERRAVEEAGKLPERAQEAVLRALAAKLGVVIEVPG